MADWDYIETGFSAADETINFGTRNFAGIDNLYETSTLASLKNTEEDLQERPNINAAIHNGSIFFAINKTMRVFKDFLCSDLSFSTTFVDEIDEFCVSQDGNFLVLCLQSGTVYCFDMKNTQNEVATMIYSETIGENTDMCKPFFLKIFVENTMGMLSFLLVLKCGQIYRIKATASTSDAVENLTLQFSFEMVVDLNCILETVSFINPLLLASGSDIHLCNVKTKNVIREECCDIKKTLLCNTRMFLALDWNGKFVQYCAKTFLSSVVNIDTLFDDFLLVSDSTTSHILGITKKNELGYNLQLISYPDYCTIFSLKISEDIHLITPEGVNDEIIYISEVKHNNKVSELRFQLVSETEPENRLRRLLRRQKFEDAEKFAKLFNLDLAEIQKAKAQVIVDKSICDEADVNILLNILNSVQDDNFKIESCVSTHSSCNNLEDVERILNYGFYLVYGSKVVGAEVQNLQDIISELMFRFNTFLALVKCNSNRNSVQEWNDFSMCNLIEELNVALERHYIEEAIIMYNRLDTTTISNLNEQHIGTILDILDNISMEQQLPFLYTFLPLTLSYIPSTIDLFINWIITKVFSIETKHPSEFPKNAIKFMQNIVHLLKVDSSMNISYQQQCIADQKSLEKLTALLQALERLQVLKNEYGIVVPLQQFLQRKETLIETLNIVIYYADNEHFLEEFIQKFILDTEFKPDEIFANVVKDIVKYSEECWIKVVPVILKSIGSIDLKLEATLIILKSANAPWCTTIREIAKDALQYLHPLVEEIVKEIQYEPKCVILKKSPYRLNEKYIDSIEDLKFVINRIIYCNEPTMIDDIYQVCKDSEEKYEADVLLINHFIQTGDYEMAFNILDNNSPEEITERCKFLKQFATIAINNQYKLPNLQENYYHIVGSIFRRLQRNATEFEKAYLEERLEILKSVYKIQNTFNLQITSKDLDDRNRRNGVLENLMRDVTLTFHDSNDISDCIKKCEKISLYLRMNKDVILLKLCEKLGNFNVILKAAEDMYANDSNPESLCRITTLILKFIGSPTIKSNEESFSQDLGNLDLSTFVNGLKLARKMVTKAILKCNTSDLGNCVELANWIQATYHFMQDGKEFPAVLRNTYGTDLNLPSISALNAIKDVFTFYVKSIGHSTNPNICYLTYFQQEIETINEIQPSTEIELLDSTVKCLCSEGQALTAYKLIITLQRGLMCNANIDETLQNSLKDILNQCIKQLLQNVFATRHIDINLAFSLLLSCDVHYSKRFLRYALTTYKRDVLKFKTVALIYLQFLQYYKIEDGQLLCTNVIHLTKWWKRIKNCRLSYEKFFRNPSDVIEKLIKLNHLNIVLIEEFCLNFTLDVQIYYELYLKYLLLNWKPDCVIQTDVYGKRQLIMKNNTEQLFQDCMEVIDIMENKKAVFDMMANIWGTINFYHYEVLICILNIISTFKPNAEDNQMLMLMFLANYTRVSKPGEAESEEWYTLYPDTQCIDFLSEWRMPFTSTLFSNKIWNIIRSEMNLRTYKKWFKAIPILTKHFTMDDICSFVVKEVIASGVFQYKNADEWNLHAKHKDLLLELDACVQNVSSLEQATSVMYCLVNNIPGGADQVNAITLCYEYALRYQKQYPHSEDNQKAVTKIQKKYFSFAATHILHTNQLADKKYLSIVSRSIDELIEALYMDDRILKKAAFVTLHCPDINKAVDELAALHQLNVHEKRCTLIKDWLSYGTTLASFSLDASLSTTSGFNVQNTLCRDGNSKNLIRASYICMSSNVTEWRTWLLALGHVETNESRNLSFKANALKCFCNISDTVTIETMTETTYQEFRNFINKLMLISGLESFGFLLSIDSLDKSNKSELLNRLAYHISSPVGVKTMASVCIAYTIYEPKYWTVIINAMLKLNMFQELKEYVNFLRKSVVFQNKKFYIDAWQAVIDNAFNLTSNMNENDLKNLCIENVYMIQSCPVLFALDLEYVVKKCIEVKKYDFAVVVLQYITKEKQNVYAEEVLQFDKFILKKVEELAQFGFCGISYVKNLFMQFID